METVKPALVIMAAGLGSRYGGLKQIASVDDAGHIIIDYSLYDAYRAGFRDVVCVINPANEKDFAERFKGASAFMNIRYAYQTLDALPAGHTVPEGRVKPWGTGHAVLCAKPYINGPFAVINADDFYGAGAYKLLYNFLANRVRSNCYAMVGYRIENTLTESGSVARGICTADGSRLVSIKEALEITPAPGGAAYVENGETTQVPTGTMVSMNMWGFDKTFLDEVEGRFVSFLDTLDNPMKGEYFLPSVVGALLAEKKVEVEILPTVDKWYGVTYANDMPVVRRAIEQMKINGAYPRLLWEEK